MDKALSSSIDSFIKENYDSIFADIARLVSINSVECDASGEHPFGEGCARVLDTALEMARSMGFETRNCENMIGYAQLGQGGIDCDKYISTITHLDIVPVGEGWTSDPFTMREREGYIIGRGVQDDKGPSVLCLYALKYLKEHNIPLRYPVRTLFGINEETGMRDVEHYLKNYPAPLFCFSPDAEFPLCNGEKGIFRGDLVSKMPMENIIDIKGGFAPNAVPDKAEAWIKAGSLKDAERVTAVDEGNGVWHLTATGVGGHASTPKGTVNAIGVLIKYILDNSLAGAQEEKFLRAAYLIHENSDGSAVGIAADDGLFAPLTVVSGMIGVENGVMVQTIDSRYPTNMNGEKIASIITEKAAGAAEVIARSDTPPFYMSTDKEEVQVCIRAYNDVTGEDAKPFTIGGGTYARDFPNAVSFGPEYSSRPLPDFAGPIHGVDEAVSKDFLLEALKIYIVALIGLEKLDLG